VFALPPEPPPPLAPYRVLVVGIGGYADGVYPVDALSTCDELPPHLQRTAAPAETSAPAESPWSLLDRANAVFVGSARPVDGAVSERLNREFRQLRAYPSFRLLVRR
jgi:hypothetical protein